jgi:hypothetical protein
VVAEAAAVEVEAAVEAASHTASPAHGVRGGSARAVWIVTGIAAICAFMLGAMLGSRGGQDEARNATARAAEIRVPAGWKVKSSGVDVPGLRASESLSVAPPSGAGGIVIGKTTASGPSLLPATFVAKLSNKSPKGDPVKLGDGEALRYEALAVRGLSGGATVFAIPTTTGVVDLVCANVADDEVKSACARAAASVALNAGKPIGLNDNASYQKRVDRTFTALNERVAARRAQLSSAKSNTGQRAGAASLAQAYAAADKSITTDNPLLVEDAAKLSALLAGCERAYANLESAIASENRSSFSAAKSAIGACDSALAKLAK